MIWSVEVIAMNNVIRLSDALYRVVTREAAARQRTPDEFAEELLARAHPDQIEGVLASRAVDVWQKQMREKGMR
jgi:hypothetical protein